MAGWQLQLLRSPLGLLLGDSELVGLLLPDTDEHQHNGDGANDGHS